MNFVKITNPKDVIDVDSFIKRSRNDNGKKVSPEIAMEVLSMTNHYVSMKLLINEINRLSPQERLEFKDFIGSALCRREHTKDNLQGLLALAEEMGILEQLKKYNNYNTGGDFNILYPCDAYKVKLGVQPVKESFAWIDDCDYYYRLRDDFSEYDCIVVDERNVPWKQAIEVYSKLPKTAIFKGDHKIVCIGDCSKLERLIADERSTIVFSRRGDELCLSDDFRFPKCERIEIHGFIDLSKFKYIKDLDCKEIYFSNCVIPKDFDFSKFDFVKLSRCDLSNVDRVEFKENSFVSISECKKLAKVLDFSKCDKLYLEINNNFENTEKIVFRDLSQGKPILRRELPDSGQLTALSVIVNHVTGRCYPNLGKPKIRFSSLVKHCKISYVKGVISSDMIRRVFGAKEKGEM